MPNRVRITLSGEGSSAEQALASVERRMGRVQRETHQTQDEMKGLNRVSSKMTSGLQGLAGAAGLAAGAAGLGYLVNRSLTAQEELLNLHKTTGIAIERIQEYQFAARKTGVGQERLNDAISEMSQRMGEAIADFERTGSITEMGEGFQAAGIGMQELKRLNPTQVFDRLSTAIQQAKDEQTALNIAAKAFGDESGRAMVAMLREGEKAIGQYIRQARDLDIVLDEDVVRKSAEAKKSITTLSVVLEKQFARVVGELAPQISEVADNMADWVSHNEDFLTQDVPGQITNIASGVKDFASAIASIPDPVLYGGLGAVMGGRVGGPYGAAALGAAGFFGGTIKAGLEDEQPRGGGILGGVNVREQAQAAREGAEANKLYAETNEMFWESMAKLNDQTEQNTQAIQKNNRANKEARDVIAEIAENRTEEAFATFCGATENSELIKESNDLRKC